MFFRLPAVAGAFYPADPSELRAMVNDFLAQAPVQKIEECIHALKHEYTKKLRGLRALIVPHAGYIYSGQTAAFGYKLLASVLAAQKVNQVILLGPAHQVAFIGAALDDHQEWQTPLGKVVIEQIKPTLPLKVFPLAHESEHCLEVQLPFLQTVLNDFKIIPILTGEVEAKIFAAVLNDLLTEEIILLVSSDLSHYHSYQRAKESDQRTIELILAGDIKKLAADGEACGLTGILTLLHLAKERKWKAQLLDYRNSGDTAGTKDQVVGYTAIAFSE